MNMLKDFLTPKKFLMVGGVVLVLVGILGFVGVIGPTPEKSIFGSHWYFDNIENWVHIVLGVIALAAAYLVQEAWQRWLVLLVGAIALFFGILNFFLPSTRPNISTANLESPADTILHIVIGIWAIASVWGMEGPKPAASTDKK